MGIFSRTPKLPEPQVDRIDYPDSPAVYRPTSQVRGVITFQSPVQRQIKSAHVSFYGHCQTACTRSESTGSGNNSRSNTVYYEDDVDLFRQSHPLAEAFTSEPGQQSTWDYNFAFPRYSKNERGEVYRKDTACSPVYQVSPHELPPSFSFFTSTSTHAHVEYVLEAAIFFEDSEKPYIVKFAPLEYSPLPPEMPPDYQPSFAEYVKPPEKYASSRLTGGEKSFRNSFRDKFSSATPSMTVTMKASIVPFLSTATAFPLYICIELDNLSDPHAINIPSVNIRMKSLKIGQGTTWRAIRTHGTIHPEHEEFMDSSISMNAVPDSRVVEVQLGPEKKQLVFPTSFEARIPSNVCASFRTVTINHAHRLKAVVEVEVAGKIFEHKFAVDNLEIMPV